MNFYSKWSLLRYIETYLTSSKWTLFSNMSFTATFVSAVCVLLPIKLRWQRNVKEIEYLRYSLKVIQLLFQRNTLILKTKIKPEWEKLSTYLLVKEVSFSTLWDKTLLGNNGGQWRTVAQFLKKLTTVIELSQAIFYKLNQCVSCLWSLAA